ncbi:membrane or secreted protein [Flammeovirgaceae bacterium SG7u.111]|nr:membrane or secreted protein [Flammeovirgaceae bacterium SG7u.132]WPO33678.1 membrane or secreted protein [Flammeovirgaceae bacterium SG7u.111]
MKKTITLFIFVVCGLAAYAQDKPVTVNNQGVMLWPDGSEVHGFGVNYTVPFAHAYRSAQKLGVDPKKAIDNDVYHFARLGFDAFRVHVWDTEISDSVGNLLANEHLELFDYLLFKLNERGIKSLITPIAFWGNGWPEPDEDTPGFSHKYGKADCLTNEAAIKAQENYLFQFLNHINPYTRIAYKNDPNIVAFEISNEPHHGEEAEEVTAYVGKMVKSMKRTGCKKPVFYNVSHSIHLADAYYKAGIDGGTFQWYPTGLGSKEELGGNLLPNVDNYDVPFKGYKGFRKKAKVVYEFDAADVGRSYIYPAMARSFRTAGIQWATHFSYDPTFLAYANTEYDTHYMNLVYAPQKALALKISSEVFHKIPLYKDFGSYPQNASFDGFSVSYQQDLAEYLGDGKFFYTNSTKTKPSGIEELEEIAGFGNSSLVQYEGQGAYFLDKLEDGLWRLEVLPDAIWVDNLFGKNSLDRTLAVINWRKWNMSVNLPDLGKGFSIKGINEGNTFSAESANSSFEVQPGTYLLSQKGKEYNRKAEERFKNFELGEFIAPKSTLGKEYMLHSPPSQINENEVYTIKAKVVSASLPQSVEVKIGTWRPKSYKMTRVSGYDYEVQLPKEAVKSGFLHYYIVVTEETGEVTYPGGKAGSPSDWDFEWQNSYKVSVVPVGSALYLFNALTDFEELNMQWMPGVKFLPTADPTKAMLNLTYDELFKPEDNPQPDYSLRYHFGKKVSARETELTSYKEIVVHGNSVKTDTAWVKVSLITSEAEIFGGMVCLHPSKGDYRVKLSELIESKLVTLPRPYPDFLPYYFESGREDATFDISKVETLQISIDTSQAIGDDRSGVQIQSIRLE